jgi:uncharacterized membrane protein
MTIELQTQSGEPSSALSARVDAQLERSVARPSPGRSNGSRQPQQLARALGWVSLGIGFSELLLPRRLGNAIGVNAPPGLLRALGLREIASGVSILARQRPGPGALQMRVAGDAIDLGLLAAAWLAPRSERARLASATAAVVGVTALDVLASRRLSAAPGAVNPLELRASVAIQRSPAELYAFWRDLRNLPRVLSHVQAVEVRESGQCHLRGRGALGEALQWDVQIGADVPTEYFAWQTVPGSTLNASGRIAFEALGTDRGTRLSVMLKFEPTAATLIKPLARMLGDVPSQRLKSELRHFKQWIETGEIATTQGQPSGRRSLLSRHLP